MTLQRFFVLSVVLHCFILLAVYKMPPREQKKQAPALTTTLVSPEVFLPREPIPPPMPRVTMPTREIRPEPRQPVPVPRPYRAPVLPDDKPLVPGEGDDVVKPPPERIEPGQGEGTSGKTEKGQAPKKRDARPGLMGREKLFDRAVTEEIARRGDSARGRGKKDDAVTLDTNEYRFMGYNRLLKGKIESIWAYPPEALAKNIYGDLKIRFTIKKNGRLGALELVRTSGYKMLDDAALRALKDGEPYWPLPDEWGMDSYTVLGHFVYSMYGSYLR